MLTQNRRALLSLLSLSFLLVSITGSKNATQSTWLEPAQAASEAVATKLPVSKSISLKDLEKYKPISITVQEDGKEVKYSGVPLRVMLAEMVPELNLKAMPGWKALSRQNLVMELTGVDGYLGLVTATELAINKAGDRFLLATHRDGKAMEQGVQLICKMDEAHTRWVRQVVSLRVVAVPK